MRQRTILISFIIGLAIGFAAIYHAAASYYAACRREAGILLDLHGTAHMAGDMEAVQIAFRRMNERESDPFFHEAIEREYDVRLRKYGEEGMSERGISRYEGGD